MKRNYSKIVILFILSMSIFTSCVPSNEYQTAVEQVEKQEIRLKEISQSNKSLQEEIKNLKDHIGSNDILINEKNNQLNELEKQVGDLEKSNKKLGEENKKLKYYERIKDFSEIEADYNSWLLKENYKQNFIKIYDEKAERIIEGSDGSLVGVNFKIRNLGDKDIAELKLNIYYLDSEGRAIYESFYEPLLDDMQSTESLNKILKSGYIWESKKNYVVNENFVPSEWIDGNIKIDIEDIIFEEN